MDDQNTPPLPPTNTPPLPKKDDVSVSTMPKTNNDAPPAPSDIKTPSMPMPPENTTPMHSAQPTPAAITDDTSSISTPTPPPADSTTPPINSGVPISPPTPSDIAALPKIPTDDTFDKLSSSKVPTEKIGDKVDSLEDPSKNDLDTDKDQPYADTSVNKPTLDMPEDKSTTSTNVVPDSFDKTPSNSAGRQDKKDDVIAPPEKDDMPVEENFPGQPLPADKMEDLEKKAEKLIEDEGGVKNRKVKVLGKPKGSTLKNIVAVMALMIVGTGVFVGQQVIGESTDDRTQAGAPTTEAACNNAGCADNTHKWEWKTRDEVCYKATVTDGSCKKSKDDDKDDDKDKNDNGTYMGNLPGVSGSVLLCGSAKIKSCNAKVCSGSSAVTQACSYDGGSGVCWKKVETCEGNNCLNGKCEALAPPPKAGACVDVKLINCESTDGCYIAGSQTSSPYCAEGSGSGSDCYSADSEEACGTCSDADPKMSWTWKKWNKEADSACKPNPKETSACNFAGWEAFASLGDTCCPTGAPDRCTQPGTFKCVDDPFISECVSVADAGLASCSSVGVDYMWKQVAKFDSSEKLWDDPRCSEKPSSTPTPPPSSSLSCTGLSFTPRQPALGEYVTVTCNGAGTGGKIVDHYDFQYKTGVVDWVTLAESGNKGVANRFQITEPGGYSMRCRACETDGSCTNWQTI